MIDLKLTMDNEFQCDESLETKDLPWAACPQARSSKGPALRSQCGGILVELAVLLPIWVTISFGLFELGSLLWRQRVVNEIAATAGLAITNLHQVEGHWSSFNSPTRLVNAADAAKRVVETTMIARGLNLAQYEYVLGANSDLSPSQLANFASCYPGTANYLVSLTEPLAVTLTVQEKTTEASDSYILGFFKGFRVCASSAVIYPPFSRIPIPCRLSGATVVPVC